MRPWQIPGIFLLMILGVTFAPGQSVEMRRAVPVALPAPADSNSPAFWLNGYFHLLTSTGETLLSTGASQFQIEGTTPVGYIGLIPDRQPVWIESVWVDEDGTVFGWYHTEKLVCGNTLSWPRIGAVVSVDGGRSFSDLGIILDAPGTPDCAATNGYFAGGNGDFSVLANAADGYFYFYFSSYAKDADSQGIGVARMAIEDRWSPARSVWKFHKGSYSEPGLGGALTPVFRAAASWNSPAPDVFWGPSLHWNYYLGQYVMLLTRSCCQSGWPTEGTYISFSGNLAEPASWSAPSKILDDPETAWYPQVLGLELGATDREAGKTARFYAGGESYWEIVFHLDNQPDVGTLGQGNR